MPKAVMFDQLSATVILEDLPERECAHARAPVTAHRACWQVAFTSALRRLSALTTFTSITR